MFFFVVNYYVVDFVDVFVNFIYGFFFFDFVSKFNGFIIIGLNRRLNNINNIIVVVEQVVKMMNNLYVIELGNELDCELYFCCLLKDNIDRKGSIFFF